MTGGAGAWLWVSEQSGPSPRAAADRHACAAAELSGLDYSRPGQGELAWSDEFDGTAVDGSRWTVRDGTTLSFDQAAIQSRNVEVRDGTLVIEARREKVGERAYSTGYLDTIGHFSQEYGRWEIRARLPVADGVSRGLWPAFWLRFDDAPGEIDVMEAWGTPANQPGAGPGMYAWNIHEDTHQTSGSGGRFHGWGTASNGPSLAEDFHVYALDWSPTCLKFSLDGAVTGSVATDAAPWLASSLRGRVNIRLNLQVGSRYWGRVEAARPELTRLPAALVVDHVRVYRSMH